MPHLDEGTIHAWLDGALSDAEARAVESHVAACATCSAAVAEARGLIAASTRILSALDEPVGANAVPPTLSLPPRESDATAARVGGSPARRRRIPVWWMRAAAVLVVAAGSLTVARVAGRGTSAFDARPATAVRAAPEIASPVAPVQAPSAGAASPAQTATRGDAARASEDARALGAPPPSAAKGVSGAGASREASAPSAKRAAAEALSRRATDAIADAADFAGKPRVASGFERSTVTTAPAPLTMRAARKVASPVDETRLIGCYDLRVPTDGSLLPPGVPHRFALDAERGEAVGGVAHFRARSLDAPSMTLLQGWWSVAGDSVTLSWPTTTGDSIQLRARAVAGGLRATVLRAGEMPVAASSPIEIERLRCEEIQR